MKGGLMSIWLMGCYDKSSYQWKTVTKVHTGHDDETLDRLQKELAPNMIKIKGNVDKIPLWLDCTKNMSPDFVAKDPKLSPVWEITGAEFSKAEIHTADGISIRFPRVTKIRDDKTWETATSLEELKNLFTESKRSSKFEMDDEDDGVEASTSTSSPTKRSVQSSPNKTSPLKKAKVESPMSMSPKTPTKNVNVGSNVPKSPEKTPIKKIKVEDDDIKVTLGASGKVSQNDLKTTRPNSISLLIRIDS